MTLAFGLTGFSAIASSHRFQCQGDNIQGTVEIVEFPSKDYFPQFRSIAKLYIRGVGAVVLTNSGRVAYFKQPILFGRGAWRYDQSRSIYNLGGGRLRLNSWPDALRLETDSSFGSAVGYLGHRDRDENRSPYDDTRYDFTCQAY